MICLLYIYVCAADPPSKKNVRGISRLIQFKKDCEKAPEEGDVELNAKEKLFFDQYGIPHGAKAKLMSDLGILARSKAKVGATHWGKEVPDRTKDSIWDELRVRNITHLYKQAYFLCV